MDEANDGDEAWQLIEEVDYDLALLDVRMPGLSGWDVIKNVSKREPGKHRPRVLMMTGLTTEFDLDKLKRLGAQGMLIKPFQNEDLVGEVKRILSLSDEEATEGPPGMGG
ncbi:MAG: response regulator [Planctomycetota bacterium]